MSSVELSPVASPVTEALILVCEKCGKKLVPEGEENPSKRLQLALKQRIFQTGRKGRLRAVVSSCLDVCPVGEITVAVLAAGEAAEAGRFFTLKGSVDAAVDTVLGTVDG
jgi:predicted metal-binding protein